MRSPAGGQDAIALSCNYMPNIPEIVDLAKRAKAQADVFVFAGGHSVSFVAADVLAHGDGAIDCILKGEGEAAVPELLAAVAGGGDLAHVRGDLRGGEGPSPRFVEHLDALRPARDLLRNRRKYFLGRWIRARRSSSRAAARGTAPSAAPGPSTAAATASRARRSPPKSWHRSRSRASSSSTMSPSSAPSTGLPLPMRSPAAAWRKRHYLETRADVLLRHKDVFRRWRDIGLEFIFIGVEAIDEDGLTRFRSATLGQNFEALEFAPLARGQRRHQPHRRT